MDLLPPLWRRWKHFPDRHYSGPTKVIVLRVAGKQEHLRVRADTGINLDELAVEMIDGNYRDVRRGRLLVGRRSAEAR
ncbi:MAG: hypothetical protein ACRET1_00895 [Burkholderiales bacterium]